MYASACLFISTTATASVLVGPYHIWNVVLVAKDQSVVADVHDAISTTTTSTTTQFIMLTSKTSVSGISNVVSMPTMKMPVAVQKGLFIGMNNTATAVSASVYVFYTPTK
jgi:hypothetical protein